MSAKSRKRIPPTVIDRKPYPSAETLSFSAFEPDGQDEKAGARRRVEIRARSPEQHKAIRARHSFGSTEKILRRNRKIWTRLYAKIGRRLDHDAIVESSNSE